MANFFAQFDDSKAAPAMTGEGDNFFAQFDNAPAPAPLPPTVQDLIARSGSAQGNKAWADAVEQRANDPNLPHFKWADVPQRLDDMARGFSNFATFGQADRIAAAAGAGTGIQGDIGGYDKNLAAQTAASEAAKTRNPVAYNAGGGLGLAASPVNKVIGAVADKALPLLNSAGELAPFLQRYANYGLQGGILNTLYQAAFGDKDTAQKSATGAAGIGAAGMVAPEGGGVGKIAMDFGKGAALGAVPPAVLEGGGTILKSVLAPLLTRLNPEEEALARIAKATKEDDLTPDMMASKIAKRGDQAMVADLSPGLQKLGGDTVQYPGEGRTFAQRQLASREGSKLATTGGAVGRVETALGTTLSDQTAVDAAKNLIQQRTEESAPVWKQLFSEPSVPESSTLDVLAKNKVVKRLMASGQDTATNFANSLGEELPVTAFAQGGKPTLQGWHAVTSELGNTISEIRRGVIPQPPDATLASLEAIHASLMKQLTNPEVNPLADQFQEALDTWAGPSAALDALQLGAKAARGDARLTTQLIGDMTDSEREFFRIGLADQAQFLASKSSSGLKAVNAIFGDQNQRRNLEAVFDTRAQFNQFRQAVAREQNFAVTKNMAIGGSPTATREAGMAELSKEIGKATLEGAKEGGAEGALMQGGKAAVKGVWVSLTQPEAMRAAMARYLYTRDPSERQALLDKIAALNAHQSIFARPGAGYIPRSTVLASKVPFTFGGQ